MDKRGEDVDIEHVDKLLTASIAAHMAYRTFGQDKKRALESLEQAARIRAEADALDPHHTAAGWAAEQQLTAVGYDTHEELTTFYAEQLS